MERWKLDDGFLKIRWREGDGLGMEEEEGLELCYDVDGKLCGVNIPQNKVDLERLDVKFTRERNNILIVCLKEFECLVDHISFDDEIIFDFVGHKLVRIEYLDF